MDTILHTASEFHKFPWDKLDPQTCTRDWSFGYGGYGFGPRVMTISYPEDATGNLWHVWECPEPLGALVQIARSAEAEEARRQVRIAIGVN